MRRTLRRKEEKKTAGRPAQEQACSRVTFPPAANDQLWGFTVSEGGLEPIAYASVLSVQFALGDLLKDPGR